MNVHQGGGRALLLPLLESAAASGPVTALLDKRLAATYQPPPNVQAKWVAPNIRARLQAEHWLKRQVAAQDRVLCFGNLPPLRRLRCPVVVFMQNRFLIEQAALDSFGWKTRLRLLVERQWLSRTAHHADTFIVQTPSMHRILCQALNLPPSRAEISPFANLTSFVAHAATDNGQREGFVYPASGDPHKNHRILIEAWILLKKQGLTPTLHLTVEPRAYPALVEWIDAQRAMHELAIVNHGHVSIERLRSLYASAAGLVYPSFIESFGLPLIEAQQAGLEVIAAELDYVRDVVHPIQTFDPHSAVSLARAIKRFLRQPPDHVELVTSDRFLALAQQRS